MPRKARLIIPNTPHHIVQRGHDRKAVFVENRDYQYYLNNLTELETKLRTKGL
jgi:putative transposase